MTFGVPLPRGLVRDTVVWEIEAGGRRHGVQHRILDRWSDGSARWMLVDARWDSAMAQDGGFVLRSHDGPASRADSVIVTEDAAGASITTGACFFTLRTGSDVLLRAGSGAPETAPVRLVRLSTTGRNGAEAKVTISSITVEDRGPLRATVSFSGVVDCEGAAMLTVLGRWDFYGGLPSARLRLTIRNPRAASHPGGFWDLGDPASVLLEDVTVSVSGESAPLAITSVQSTLERGMSAESFGVPFELYQDSSGGPNWNSPNHVNRERRVPNKFRGYRLAAGPERREGLRATPIVVASTTTGSIAVTSQYFWENCPKAVEVSASSVDLRLFPRQHDDVHEIQPGEQKTHDVMLLFGDDPVTTSPLDWARSPTTICATPAWTYTTGAIPFLGPVDDGHRTLIDAAVDGTDTFAMKREVVDQFGWRHFGDIYGDHEAIRHSGPAPLVSHYNNQYDPLAGFCFQFLRTADVRWWEMAEALAHHVIDIDVYHTDQDKSAYNHGLFWHTYHYGDADTATHRTYPKSAKGHTHGGGPSADHNYTTGLMLYWFLTGDPVARQTAIDCGQYVIDMDDGRKAPLGWLDGSDTGRSSLSLPGYYGPGRAAANSLNALLDAHRLSGERRFSDKAERVLRRVFHPAENIERHSLDDPEYRWFYTMFLQSVGKYLNDKVERGEVDEAYAYARASLLHYARWMATHEYPYLEKPEKLIFPTETWSAQDIRKSDVFYHAALHADSTERATLLERAEFFHRHSVTALASAPTRTLARPVIVLLTSGLMHGWMTAQSTVPALPPAGNHDFGHPQHFVPQRERVKRKVAALGVLGAVASVSSVLIWWLW